MIEISCFYSLSSPWAYFAGPKRQDRLDFLDRALDALRIKVA